MEDFVHVEPSFADHPERMYVGVFDGHGGESVARLAARDLHGLLAAELRADVEEPEAFSRTFQSFDESVAEETGGAVAAVLLLERDAAWVANAGDVTVVLVSRGGERVLTADHRLGNPVEYDRVRKAGAIIERPYAFLPNGDGLMPTRSLGDRPFRAIGILAEPEVSSFTLTQRDAWIVVGTDGVFDFLEPETVARLVRAATTANLAAERIRDAALQVSDDNVTVVAIRR